MVPFIEKCLSILFPLSQLQSVLLVPDNDLDKLKAMTKLDVNDIFVGNILSLIPEPVELVEEKPEEVRNEKPTDIENPKTESIQEIQNETDNVTVESTDPVAEHLTH